MANCCKDCDRLQPKVSGNGAMRPEFQQPTLYDHFTNFQKFKQNKDEQLHIQARKEELSQFNKSFTDWQLNPSTSKDEFEELGTQEIARFRHQVRMRHQCSRSVVDNATQPPSEASVSTLVGGGDKSLQKKVSLLTISRTPVQCPIGVCERTIGVTSVLSHYLRDHSEDFGVQCQEIFGGKRSILVFDPSTLEFRDNVCLGVLAYGGINQKSLSRPAERGICMHNAFLPKPHEKFDAHLPILIMACKTSWSAMLEDKELEAKITNPENAAQHLLIVWLVSVQTTKPTHCTITVFDKAMAVSRSTITQVRHLNQAQNPSEFLNQDTNCLRLCRGEIELLSHGGTECIHMEIMIHEYDQ